METLYAVYLIGSIDGEWNSIQTLSANDARKARRMIWFSGSSQYPIENRPSADATLFQRIKIVLLAVRFTLERVEWFSLKIDTTHEAAETINMKYFVHCRATCAFSLDSFAALCTDTINIAVLLRILHSLYQKIRQRVNLIAKTREFLFELFSFFIIFI